MSLMSQPEWTMFGMKTRGGVRLIASNSLMSAQLDSEYPLHRYFQSLYERDAPEHTLSVTMADFVVIDAVSYPSAFAKLFRAWSPDGEEPIPFAEHISTRGASISVNGPVACIEERKTP